MIPRNDHNHYRPPCCQETGDSPRAIRSSIRRTVTGFFPTVAWPSEAVRVRDESIALTHKQVGAPFTGRRGVAGLIKAQTQRPGGLG